jgi:hypothetical protein
MDDSRPPVFLEQASEYNVIMEPELSDDRKEELLEEIPFSERHRWFRSMSSSQAFSQSIFGNLKLYDKLGLLNGLTDISDKPLFDPVDISAENLRMEYRVDYLGEPRPTSVDVFISGDYQVAVECKLTETEVGACSRPRLREGDINYLADFCDGTYTIQKGRNERCSLTETGVLYWKYIPDLFTWPNHIDLKPCPLNLNYQLVRNLLAACVRPDGNLSPENGHMVLIYDDRNPAFKIGGKGFVSFEAVKAALRFPNLLRKCSWQQIIKQIGDEPTFKWLSEGLETKYGLKVPKIKSKLLDYNTVEGSLDYLYDKAIQGLPGIQSAVEMAENYLNKEGSLEEKVNSLIMWQDTKSATSGFLSGLGGVLTLPVAIPANLGSVLFVQMRMIAAIAHMGGQDLKDDKVRTFVYVCLCGNTAKDVLKEVGIKIGKQLTTQAIKRIPFSIISKINRAVGFRLLTKFGTKGAVNLGRAVPIAGGVVGGGIDLFATHAIGKFAKKSFIHKGA